MRKCPCKTWINYQHRHPDVKECPSKGEIAICDECRKKCCIEEIASNEGLCDACLHRHMAEDGLLNENERRIE